MLMNNMQCAYMFGISLKNISPSCLVECFLLETAAVNSQDGIPSTVGKLQHSKTQNIRFQRRQYLRTEESVRKPLAAVPLGVNAAPAPTCLGCQLLSGGLVTFSSVYVFSSYKKYIGRLTLQHY